MLFYMQGPTDKQALWGFLAAVTAPPAVASLLATAGAIQALPLLVPSMFAAAYIGGIRPGLLAAISGSVTAGYYLVVEGANPTGVEIARCVSLFVAAAVLSVVANKLRQPTVLPVQPLAEPVAEPVAELPAPVVTAEPVGAPAIAPVPVAIMPMADRQRTTRSIPMPMMHADKATLHDLNNALAIISGNVGLLAESFAEDHPDRELVTDIEAAVMRAAQISRKLARPAPRDTLTIVRERRPSMLGAA